MVFTIGHDKKFRPIIYFAPAKVKESEIDLFTRSMSLFCLLITRYLLRDYYIENWVIIMDLEKKGFLNFPFKAIQATMRVTSLMFAGRLHKMYMLNPTVMFYGLWKLVSKIANPDTVAKIQILKKSGFTELLSVISPDQLLEKYGGTLSEPAGAFPITTTFAADEKPFLSEDDIKSASFIASEDGTHSSYLNHAKPMGTIKNTFWNSPSRDWDVG